MKVLVVEDEPLIRRTGWLAAAAYAGNTAWELWAQGRGIGWRLPGPVLAAEGPGVHPLLRRESLGSS